MNHIGGRDCEEAVLSVSEFVRSTRPGVTNFRLVAAAALVALASSQPARAWETLVYVAAAMVHVTPIVIPGILLAAWITASGASDRVAAVFHGRTVQTVLAATVIGAALPVCGVTVLPLMAGLLAAGVPLAPVMAFWLASPITGPAMLSATVATLGWEFAVGKALAAIGARAAGRVRNRPVCTPEMGEGAAAIQQARQCHSARRAAPCKRRRRAFRSANLAGAGEAEALRKGDGVDQPIDRARPDPGLRGRITC